MTNGKDDAFPTLIVGENVRGDTGLTKREYFAAMAMQGILANGQYDADWKRDPDESFNATQSVRFADALIDALNATK